MSKRVANRRGPGKNKAGRNSLRLVLRRDITAARDAEDKSWFLRLINKLARLEKNQNTKALVNRYR